MGRLDGKVALITGAASGMGRVAAELFALEGAIVAAVDVLDASDTVIAVREKMGDAISIQADAADPGSVSNAVNEVLRTFGHLDVLYNNAGISHADDGGPLDTPLEVWDETMAVNVRGVWLFAKAALPALVASGNGSIINVASFVAFMGAATPQLAYTTSKGAVMAMTREMAVIYARQGVRVNALCPGPVLTPLLEKFLSDEEKRQRRLVHIPMGRFGQAEEMAKGALFLASDESSYMTGQSLVIDGGITAAYVTPE
jgi:NAD(P)-dependent dehydrogenase (short-subunit alcohol dehydrogenase family)